VNEWSEHSIKQFALDFFGAYRNTLLLIERAETNDQSGGPNFSPALAKGIRGFLEAAFRDLPQSVRNDIAAVKAELEVAAMPADVRELIATSLRGETDGNTAFVIIANMLGTLAMAATDPRFKGYSARELLYTVVNTVRTNLDSELQPAVAKYIDNLVGTGPAPASKEKQSPKLRIVRSDELE
jgi:hypothetical protein